MAFRSFRAHLASWSALLLLTACGVTEAPTPRDDTSDPVDLPTTLTKDEPRTVTFTAEGAWRVSSDAAWLLVDPASGDGGDASVTVWADPSLLPSDGDPDRGEAAATLSYDDRAGTRTFTVTMLLPDVVPPEQAELDLNAEPGTTLATAVSLGNAGRADLDIQGVATNAEWLEAQVPAGGVVPAGGEVDLGIQASCDATEGVREGSVYVSHDDPFEGEVIVDVRLTCEGTGDEPSDPFDPPATLTKDEPHTESFTAVGAWRLSSDAVWLLASPTSGEGGDASVTVWADPSLIPSDGDPNRGEAAATLSYDDAAGTRTSTVTVLLPDVVPPVEGGVDLTTEPGSTVATVVSLGNAGRADLEIQGVATNVAWLEAQGPAGGVVPAGGAVEVGIQASCDATEGVREGSVFVTHDDPFEGEVTVDVRLNCEAATTERGFDIELVFFDDEDMTTSQREVFYDAAERWGRVLTEDLPDYHLTKAENACGTGEPAFDGTVDDLLIFASVADIDGRGGIVAQAGPCVRRSSGLPAWGVMRFDRDDLGRIEDFTNLEGVVLHEMAHVLGFGTIGAWRARVDPQPCPDAGVPFYDGAEAVISWQNAGGSGDVPVEYQYGPGTDCGHWHEGDLDHELMTGILDADMRLSAITIGAFDDLGYAVDYGQADPYTVPLTSLQPQEQTGLHLQEDLIRPQGDPVGR